MISKNLLGYLSIKGEVGEAADPGTVSQTAGDAGGWSYGLFQFNSTNGIVQGFVGWLQEQDNAYGQQLAVAGDPTCDQGFADKWAEIGAVDPDDFAQLQDRYAKMRYYDPGAVRLLSVYAFDIEPRSLPVRQVLFANAVQHGPRYGADAFAEGAASIGKELAAMEDGEIIVALYNNKINDPAWSQASPDLRPGLFARWERERDEAIELLAGGHA